MDRLPRKRPATESAPMLQSWQITFPHC